MHAQSLWLLMLYWNRQLWLVFAKCMSMWAASHAGIRLAFSLWRLAAGCSLAARLCQRLSGNSSHWLHVWVCVWVYVVMCMYVCSCMLLLFCGTLSFPLPLHKTQCTTATRFGGNSKTQFRKSLDIYISLHNDNSAKFWQVIKSTWQRCSDDSYNCRHNYCANFYSSCCSKFSCNFPSRTSTSKWNYALPKLSISLNF